MLFPAVNTVLRQGGKEMRGHVRDLVNLQGHRALWRTVEDTVVNTVFAADVGRPFSSYPTDVVRHRSELVLYHMLA
jgi:hypothetical protein